MENDNEEDSPLNKPFKLNPILATAKLEIKDSNTVFDTFNFPSKETDIDILHREIGDLSPKKRKK